MKKLFILFGLSCLTAFGAANGINGEVITKVGTTGTVQLPGSQTTNVTISLVSKVTDGASAVAFSLNSSNALTTSGAKLVTIANDGTNVYTFSYRGELAISGTNPELDLVIDANALYLSAAGGPEIYGQRTDNAYFDLALTGGVGLRLDLNNWMVLAPEQSDGNTPYTFDTSVAHTSSNLAEFKNNTTNKVWFTYDGEVHAKDFVMEASALKTSTTSGHSGTFQAYDEDNTIYRTFATLQNGNTPSLTIAPPSGGSVTLQGILKSADGTSGITTNIVAGLVTFTIKNGIITGVSL